ncbi:MAG: alpha/beta hydrolase [Planctomycetota bacterium]
MRVALTIVLLLVACKTIDVTEQNQEEWIKQAKRSILTDVDVSDVTYNMLRRRGLHERYRDDPVGVLAVLREEMYETRARDLAAAIAEVAALQARKWTTLDRRAVMTVVRYSYAYLFDPKLEPAPSPFDAQFRWALDLYTTSLAYLIRDSKQQRLEDIRKQRFPWYGGTARIEPGVNDLRWAPDQFPQLDVALDYVVEGLPRPDHRRGFGVPCILRRSWDRQAALQGRQGTTVRYLLEDLNYSVTYVARLPDGTSVLDEEETRWIIDIYDPTITTHVTIEGIRVPLELDYVTPIALTFANQQQQVGLRALLRQDESEQTGGLYMFQPWVRGKIPVLMVHGLASDPLTWLPLYTDLMANETIRTRCQFAFWLYPTGQPVPASAMQLREAIRGAMELVDPNDADPADQYGVVCGHSMGGLLARMLVIESGMKLWDLAFDHPPEKSPLKPADLQLVRDALIFERMPGIRRVIFYATPHGGSPGASKGLGRFMDSLTKVPQRFSGTARRVRSALRPEFRNVPRLTSVNSLREDNPMLQVINTIPIDPSVTYHSIIGDTRGAGRTDGTDGIVPYSSSHIPGAKTELVLQSGHSVQHTPKAARETRRILLEHIAAFDAAQAKK